MFTDGEESNIEYFSIICEKLDEIYESEINFSIVTSDEFGYKAEIGSEYDGFIDSNSFGSFIETLDWITEKAKELYPESDYAKKYKIACDVVDYINDEDNENGC